MKIGTYCEKRVIWSNMNLELDEHWQEEYKDFCQVNGIKQGDEQAAYNWMVAANDIYFEDDYASLNVCTGGKVLVIADLGRWDGRRPGYKISTANLNTILDIPCDNFEVFSDGHNIRATGCHHDGQDFYLFRAIREGVDVEPLLDAIYNGEYISEQKLNYYTRSLLPDVAKVYGWEV